MEPTGTPGVLRPLQCFIVNVTSAPSPRITGDVNRLIGFAVCVCVCWGTGLSECVRGIISAMGRELKTSIN